MAHVFISYSKRDIRFARYLKGLLEDAGFPVWMDEAEISPSAVWSRTIETNILECSAFVVIMSDNSKESEWVEREVLLAEREHKPIFPILLSGEVWFRLANIQYIDMRNSLKQDLPPLLHGSLRDVFEGRGHTLRATPRDASSISKRKRGSRSLPIIASIVVALLLLAALGIALLWNNQFAVNFDAYQVAADTKVAFISREDGEESELWVMNADDTNLTRLTNTAGTELDPQLSPDGTRIAFASDMNGDFNIYVIDVDGSNLTQITDSPFTQGSPTWSPDGMQIAYVSNQDGNDNIYIGNVDGTDAEQLTTNSESDYSPAWSPDGMQIAFWSSRAGSNEIYIQDIDGSESPMRVTDNQNYGYSVDWSPDGTQLAFELTTGRDYDIYVIDVNGENQQKITEHPANDAEPVWSADGSYIMFVSERDGNKELYTISPSGADPRRLLYNIANDYNPTIR